MNPWELLDRAQTPGNGEELRLYRRDQEFSIKAGNYELMNSRIYGSEDALAQLACEMIKQQPHPRVLIGGLGMGYTVRSTLDGLGTKAQVVVAEIVPAVVRWNREVLAELAGKPLDDGRVVMLEADVAEIIKKAKSEYDAIMLDVDNGPQAITRKDNDWLYSPAGLNAALAALRPKGVLAIWSSSPDSAFVQRLGQAGFEVDEVRVRARGVGKGSGGKSKGGAHHIVWIARRI